MQAEPYVELERGVRETEFVLLDMLASEIDAGRTPCVFILGAPRTGSTFLYQALVSCFRLPYIANLTNDHWAQRPLVGLALQKALSGRENVGFRSAYGKVSGPLAPSEGSAVMRHWFGGGHPSQLVSTEAVRGRESELVRTLQGAWTLYGRPLVVKNAWNCFRIAWLARALPRAAFVWVRRDIAAAARSDLLARYAVHGDASRWNSATPANVEDIRKLPPAHQVVENQYEFTRAIDSALAALDPHRHARLWYEDLCAAPAAALQALGARMTALGDCVIVPQLHDAVAPTLDADLPPSPELEEVSRYVESHARLRALRRAPGPGA
jgi:hypothetical protein